jgi:nitrate reductase NapE component
VGRTYPASGFREAVAKATAIGYQGTMRPTRRHTSAAMAYAEGRRLRRAAELRRSRRHRLATRAVVAVTLVPIVLMGATMVVTAALVGGFALLVFVFSMLGPPALIAGTVAFAVTRRRRAGRRSAGTAPLPHRPAAPPRPDLVWAHARDRFHALAGEYAAHECDPAAVLHLPALSDVRVPSTARFVDAFAEAQALETDAFPGPQHADAFVRAADRAVRAWRAAREAADRIRLSGLSADERASVERVIKLLTVARDSDSEAERLAAYARARAELHKLDAAGVVHLPRTAAAALDSAARGSLPAA